MLSKRLVALFLFLIFFSDTEAQSNIDSLKSLVAKAAEDSNKVKLLLAVSAGLTNSSPADGAKWSKDAQALAVKTGWKKGEAMALMQTGNSIIFLSDFTTAIKCYNDAEKIYEQLKDKKGLAKVYNSKAKVYLMQGQYPEALDNNMKALKIAEETNDESLTAQSLGSIGSVYFRQGKTNEALSYYGRASALFEKLGNQQGLGMCLSNIGAVNLATEHYDSALFYLKKALSVNEQTGAFDLVGMNIANLAGVYQKKKQYNLALAYSMRSLRMNIAMGDMNSKGIDEMNIGISYLLSARDSVNAIKPDSLMPAYKAMVVQKAIDYLEAAKTSITNVSGDLNALAEVYSNLSIAYHLAGRNELGFKYNEIAVKLKDSVFSMDNRLKIADLGMQRAKAEKDQQAKLTKLSQNKRRNEAILFSVGIVLLIVTIVFVSKERRKSDKLLLNILPAEVATELKKTGGTAAKYFDEVTVLFTDFVNFTTVAERLSPQALVDELHTCFKAFDEIISKYKIEKIKTVGDAYLAVSGLPVRDPLHAENVINAAMEITEFVRKRKAQLGENTFEIRVGINSGSVVAGIVGVKKFAYDIWGDTVNIAARMEQHSEAGKINISQATYELVKGKFKVQYRGEIEVKGKGGMAMYFVG